MIDYLFQNKNMTEIPSLTEWWGYGCWCIAHGENPLLAKRGLPADNVDSYVFFLKLAIDFLSVCPSFTDNSHNGCQG